MSWILPGLIFALLIYAYCKRTDVHAAFIEGAAEALPVLLHVMPCMTAMVIALTLFRESGAMEAFIRLVSPACEKLGLPSQLAPMFLLRPFSGGAAMALLKDVYDAYGPDSYYGYAASIMLGSTETIFYTVSLYLGSIGVKKSRHAVPAALAAAVAGTAAALVFAAGKGV